MATKPTQSLPVWLIGIYAAAAAGSAAMVAVGVDQSSDPLLTAGALGLIIVAATAPIAHGLRVRAPQQKSSTDGDLRVQVGELREAIDRLSEGAVLSDDARRVLNRKRERELLRAAIEEDITAEDWDAAMVLVKELAERFGYRADAEEFRNRIETVRFRTDDRRVEAAVENLDRLITQLRWGEAQQEAERLIRLYPDSARIDGLRHRVVGSQQRYKHELERRFLLAAEQDQVDDALELLRELDAYLTETEAEPYREVARGVIGKARENLGVQFKLAVHDRAWDRAAVVGERVLSEFPNTQMAAEIRDMMDELRERASTLR